MVEHAEIVALEYAVVSLTVLHRPLSPLRSTALRDEFTL